jgi:hypothetical protein
MKVHNGREGERRGREREIFELNLFFLNANTLFSSLKSELMVVCWNETLTLRKLVYELYSN